MGLLKSTPEAKFNGRRLTGPAFFMAFFGAMLGLAVAAASAQAREYLGEIPFPDSEKVEIHFYVSEDGREVQKTLLSLKKLPLKAAKDSGISSATLTDAGLTDETVYKIVDGKLTADSFFVFDLTVIDSCVYGTIGLNYDTGNGQMTADPVYVVLPNITTPQDIPESILKP